jgi:group I intron endonuclease
MIRKLIGRGPCGIYKITCLPTGKFYIGSSVTIHKRWHSHVARLNRKVHENPYLQNVWDKYKEENFSFEIIEIVPRETLIEREQYWLDSTKCYERDIGYNISRTTERFDLENHPTRKTWIVTMPSGEEILVKNLTDFCLENNIASSLRLHRVATGRRSHYKGYKCRYGWMSKEEWENLIKEKFPKRYVRYKVIKPDGSVVIIDNLEEFCVENNIIPASLHSVINGNQSHHRGYIIKKLHKKLYVITTPTGEIIETDNMRKFCKENNLSQPSMIEVYLGRATHHKGYKCERIVEYAS